MMPAAPGNEPLERRIAELTLELAATKVEFEAFVHTMAHDLKAPLRGLQGFTRALQEDYADRLDATGIRYLTMVEGSARRMGALIDDLLGYWHLGRRELRRERTLLRPVVDEVLAALGDAVRARRLTLRVDLTVEAVEAERHELRAALMHLLGNAVKFSRDGGPPITIGSTRDQGDVLVWVADGGIGFDMKYHERIFGVFERLHRQEDYPGTGIGLAIVHKVARRHGGRTWAVSEPGKGSTFYLALPERVGATG